MIDLYCERVGDTFFAEPVNSLSNIVFFLSAIFIWLHAHKNGIQNVGIYLLIFLIVAIGSGSILFHIYATSLTQILDVAPILLFQFLYLWLYLHRVLLFGLVSKIIAVIFLAVLIVISFSLLDYLNGSIQYFPALLTLVAISIFHHIKGKEANYRIDVAIFLFILALFFKAIDNYSCVYSGIGTHFIWHIANGIVVYLLYRSLAQYYLRQV